MENEMIDWITGWINLLLTDYESITFLGMFLSFLIINVIFFLWSINKKHANLKCFLFSVISFCFLIILLVNSATIEQIPFYIKHNGKYSNVVKECLNQSHDDSEYYSCVYKYIDYQKQIEEKKREIISSTQDTQEFESKKKQIFEKINNHP